MLESSWRIVISIELQRERATNLEQEYHTRSYTAESSGHTATIQAQPSFQDCVVGMKPMGLFEKTSCRRSLYQVS
ncbi:hypothetical protein Ae201684_015412 [Aphanomyces euteiches]|uniref:Uncharacterized protein n=1 Tax=Aphanomyces euteiches TaxID=100861 RepID=A0A6G0WGM2_9STRA|nr:hypothetical protein Ae201684_015412 [Aphanomyces euteiches]